MTTRLIKIGNSRGIRLPQKLTELYRLSEGDELILEERRDGILIHPAPALSTKIPWETAYAEMVAESAENSEWDEWDAVTGDGKHD